MPLSTSSLITTALVFHQTAILGERGLDVTVAAAAFVPYAVTSALISLVSGVLIDRSGPKRMFAAEMGLLLAAMALLFIVDSWPTAVVYSLVLGASGGIARVISGVTWAHFYGRHRLGRIQGSAVMVNITNSALGPMLFALLEERLGGFGGAVLVSAVLPLASLVMISFARPQAPTARRAGEANSRRLVYSR